MDEKIKLREELISLREKLEKTIQAFDGQKMWFQELTLQFDGIVSVKTDSWGVNITITSDHREPLTVSGRWDILFVSESRISAAYAGWNLSKECNYPNLGISV